MISDVWEKNYQDGRYNKYPYDKVVSFVMNTFARCKDRSKIRILDLGCGGGTHARFVTEEGFSYWGIDGSPESIKKTKNALGHDLKEDRVLLADFCSMPFENNYFDAVLDRQSLGHNHWDDIKQITSEIHRILKNGGHYYGQIFSVDHPDLKFGIKGENLDYSDFSSGRFFKAEFVHVFDIQQIKETFSKFDIKSLLRIKEENALESNILLDEFFEIVCFKNWD